MNVFTDLIVKSGGFFTFDCHFLFMNYLLFYHQMIVNYNCTCTKDNKYFIHSFIHSFNNFIIFLVFCETAKYNLFPIFDRNPSCPATATWPLFILFSLKFRLTFPSRNFSDLVENYTQGKHILKHF